MYFYNINKKITFWLKIAFYFDKTNKTDNGIFAVTPKTRAFWYSVEQKRKTGDKIKNVAVKELKQCLWELNANFIWKIKYILQFLTTLE